MSVLIGGTVGCQYYGEFRVKKTTADLQEERAALLHDYRVCLEKYQDEPPKAKEVCGPIPSGSERSKSRTLVRQIVRRMRVS